MTMLTVGKKLLLAVGGRRRTWTSVEQSARARTATSEGASIRWIYGPLAGAIANAGRAAMTDRKVLRVHPATPQGFPALVLTSRERRDRAGKQPLRMAAKCRSAVSGAPAFKRGRLPLFVKFRS